MMLRQRSFAALILLTGCATALDAGESGSHEEPRAQQSAGDADGSPPPAPAPAEDATCGVNLLQDDGDTSKAGPWPVAQKTVTIGRMTVELWYPAKVGSEAGKDKIIYDPRRALPESEQSKVPDSEVPVVVAKDPPTYRDLPLDTEHGPYPAVFFVHGTTSFREASYTLTAHWASHGFIVIAADHPGMNLSDFMKASSCQQKPSGAQDIEADVDAEIAALTNPQGELAFLAGHVDMSRIALSGHSQGAWLTAKMSSKPNVQLIMPLSTTTGTSPSPTLRSTFILAATTDTVIPFKKGGNGIANFLSKGSNEEAFTASPGRPTAIKRLVGVDGAGHLLMTDLCRVNAAGKNSIQVAQAHGVCGISLQPAIFDCNKIDVDRGLTIVGDATTAALEETLHCSAGRAERIRDLPKRYPEIVDFRDE